MEMNGCVGIIKREGLFLFKNIGRKLKIWAYVHCIVLTLAALVFSVMVLISACEAPTPALQVRLTLYSLGILLGGFLISWISSFFIYGFGELIDRSVSMDKQFHYLLRFLSQ